MDQPAFTNLLNKNRVDGVVWTHVSLFCPKGKYQMEFAELEEITEESNLPLWRIRNV